MGLTFAGNPAIIVFVVFTSAAEPGGGEI